jgi:hypothetical protein
MTENAKPEKRRVKTVLTGEAGSLVITQEKSKTDGTYVVYATLASKDASGRVSKQRGASSTEANLLAAEKRASETVAAAEKQGWVKKSKKSKTAKVDVFSITNIPSAKKSK